MCEKNWSKTRLNDQPSILQSLIESISHWCASQSELWTCNTRSPKSDTELIFLWLKYTEMVMAGDSWIIYRTSWFFTSDSWTILYSPTHTSSLSLLPHFQFKPCSLPSVPLSERLGSDGGSYLLHKPHVWRKNGWMWTAAVSMSLYWCWGQDRGSMWLWVEHWQVLLMFRKDKMVKQRKGLILQDLVLTSWWWQGMPAIRLDTTPLP